ncbi:acetyltransferase (GNAT) family protein [Kribbella amoyensis]|uniref:Acetyltransferase (GNAT) family protein n=1 Tax=Kribbella amoyensis TaxID=996641 RepID=A0A561BQP1_9ACTN|nr:GNAT family N-acetyltransferase [Kribbella amoyensis]TWD81208.1 acetyltransferase (GNAT) family protein [Kribbella amoyensis]
MTTITLTYLEQTSPDDLRPAKEPREPVEVRRVDEVAPEFSRFLYTAVGGPWHWTGKLGWTWDRWTEWLSRPGAETWVAWTGGAPAGYVALHADGTEVEIENFGLLPAFIGRGIGGHLLTVGLRQAWRMPERLESLDKVTRVWLHTNTLDGPNALANYQARGLRPYKTEQEERADADGPPPGPWPGADQPAS